MEIFSNIKALLDEFTVYLGVDSPLAFIKTIVDIGILAFIIYKLIRLVKETRAWQLLKGILIILIATEVSKLFGLKTINYILSNTLSVLAIAAVVLFQPELRRGLEKIGRSKFKDIIAIDNSDKQIRVTAVIEEIINACTALSQNYIGALIVIERETRLGEIINGGVALDAAVSSELLQNIFTKDRPLHDGAVIIRDNRIMAASCYLPLTDDSSLGNELGTRHRAALGISEISDSVTIVVSEESGKISVAINGGLTRALTADTLRQNLNKNLLVKPVPNKKLALWRNKSR